MSSSSSGGRDVRGDRHGEEGLARGHLVAVAGSLGDARAVDVRPGRCRVAQHRAGAVEVHGEVTVSEPTRRARTSGTGERPTVRTALGRVTANCVPVAGPWMTVSVGSINLPSEGRSQAGRGSPRRGRRPALGCDGEAVIDSPVCPRSCVGGAEEALASACRWGGRRGTRARVVVAEEHPAPPSTRTRRKRRRCRRTSRISAPLVRTPPPGPRARATSRPAPRGRRGETKWGAAIGAPAPPAVVEALEGRAASPPTGAPPRRAPRRRRRRGGGFAAEALRDDDPPAGHSRYTVHWPPAVGLVA